MSQRKILVVDDEKSISDTLSLFLEMEGHIATSARSGSEAISLYPDFLPDLVILDLNMPGMDGFELAEKLREMSRDLTLVALSGDCRDGVEEMIEAAGFNHRLVKPSSPDDIRNLLSELDS